MGQGAVATPEATPLPSTEPPWPLDFKRCDYRVFCLETTGQIQHQFDLPSTEASGGASFGLVDQQLLLRVSHGFLVVDPGKFAIREKIPVYDSQDFPSKQNLELMTIDEQRDAYQPLFDAQLTKGTDSKWLDWKPGGQYFVLATAPTGKRSAWSPMTYEDSLIVDLKSRMASIPVALNPKANDQRNGSDLQISDESVQIRQTDYLSADTQLDYPNYKKRGVLQYEMKLGDQTFHFSTTDKDRHDLRIGFSDNLMLVTADGCAWVKYESVLYKISKK